MKLRKKLCRGNLYISNNKLLNAFFYQIYGKNDNEEALLSCESHSYCRTYADGVTSCKRNETSVEIPLKNNETYHSFNQEKVCCCDWKHLCDPKMSLFIRDF